MSETKNVSFKATKEQIELIDRAVESGRFTSRGEFLRSLLRKVEDVELSEEAKRDIEEARKQEGKPLDELF
ncbi:MAG: type II toxin-antitoxin system ParD family antitoxin [Candidatus Hadarchaeota archaeon]|nr:type II toxin-antitoxin system ParD family antitoxin [Candidatus Hadarchaeota archaeon]